MEVYEIAVDEVPSSCDYCIFCNFKDVSTNSGNCIVMGADVSLMDNCRHRHCVLISEKDLLDRQAEEMEEAMKDG